jgi:hypothetical protein
MLQNDPAGGLSIVNFQYTYGPESELLHAGGCPQAPLHAACLLAAGCMGATLAWLLLLWAKNGHHDLVANWTLYDSASSHTPTKQ